MDANSDKPRRIVDSPGNDHLQAAAPNDPW